MSNLWLQPKVKNNGTGFTLIELLLVIAVIGILAALLLPALRAARDKAHTSRCLSNLRQIYMGLTMFADEHNDLFPIAGSTIAWGAIDGSTGQPSWMEQISPYIQNRRVYRCPADDRSEFSYFLGTRAAYILTTNQRAVARQRIVFPSEFVLTGDTGGALGSGPFFDPLDADKDDYSQNCVGGPTGGGGAWVAWQRHGAGQNILFADGHAKWCGGYVPSEMTFRYDSISAW